MFDNVWMPPLKLLSLMIIQLILNINNLVAIVVVSSYIAMSAGNNWSFKTSG